MAFIISSIIPSEISSFLAIFDDPSPLVFVFKKNEINKIKKNYPFFPLQEHIHNISASTTKFIAFRKEKENWKRNLPSHISECLALLLGQSFIVKGGVIGTRHCNWAKRIDGLNKSFTSSISIISRDLEEQGKEKNLGRCKRLKRDQKQISINYIKICHL